MDVKVYPGYLNGIVKVPPSKSAAHRVLIAAALAEGISEIKGISDSDDMHATVGCLRELGADVELKGSEARVAGIAGKFTIDSAKPYMENPRLDCRESGSTLRFLLPVAAALGAGASFTGRGKLPERPITALADEMKAKGIRFLPGGRDALPFIINGQLEPGVYRLPGDVSSQYISGLMFALPLLADDSQIELTSPLESAGYLDLTMTTLHEYGITVERTDKGYFIRGGQNYRACDTEVEGDYSNAAFWLVAGACDRLPKGSLARVEGTGIIVSGLKAGSVQGDRRIADLLRNAGAAIDEHDYNGYIQYRPLPSILHGSEIDCGNIPDIIPVLAVAAAISGGTTRFYNAGRLRLKESDRLAAMADCLSRIGARVRQNADELTVQGGHPAGGCEVNGYNDHRIVMSMAIAALFCEKPVIIRGAEAVAKSYPDFFEEFTRLGGRIDVI